MKADKSKMLSIPLAQLKPGAGAPFPLYIFLKENDRMILVVHKDAPFEQSLYERLSKENHDELWIPRQFEPLLGSFLEYIKQARVDGTSVEPTLASTTDTNKKDTSELSAQAGERQLLETPSASTSEDDAVKNSEQKASAQAQSIEPSISLAEIGREILKQLHSMNEYDSDQIKEYAAKSKKSLDPILDIAAKLDPIYEEVKLLRSIQSPDEHSIFVGSLAAAATLFLGHDDAQVIGDVMIAATFHDIGLIQTGALSLKKPPSEWSEVERLDYQSHVEKSLSILKKSEISFPPQALRMIREHHERCDGEGFPARLSESLIDESSKVLFIANLFDRLCRGEETGQSLAPKQAIEYLKTNGAVLGASSKLIETLFNNSYS